MAARGALTLAGVVLNKALSFVVFTFLDLLDAFLCLVYKLLDFVMEGEWKPCYCTSARDMISAGSGDILVTEDGASKILCLSSSNKLHLDDISDTLYLRPSLLSDVLRSTLREMQAMMIRSTNLSTTIFTINAAIVEILQGKVRQGQQQMNHVPRWSDCHCKSCTSWISSSTNSLYVHVQGDEGEEDVLFIHGFISSALFWTETVFESFTDGAKGKYRMFAVDLMGFGRSPKPADSLYTLQEHVDMIERSVLEAYGVKSLHIVAHSLGSILALALAVKYPDAVKSLTLIAPPYYPMPEGEVNGAQYVLRKLAPRRVWPPMQLGASVACWYEHISRTISFLLCKHHRFLEQAVRWLTMNRVRTFLMDGFFCNTHNAAWHTFHNIICGGAVRMDSYLEVISNKMTCDVAVFHGRDDELIPIKCSLDVASRVSRARVHIFDDKDHLTIVVGRQKVFAGELEAIWDRATSNKP